MRVRAWVWLVLAGGCKDVPTVTDVPVPTGPTVAPIVEYDCSAYVDQGEVYDCEAVDFNDGSPANLAALLACCDCNVAYCIVDDCDPTPAAPLPPGGFAPVPSEVTSCMNCHNGAEDYELQYSGPGLANPHFFGAAAYIGCAGCHGGDGSPGNTAEQSHVTPPPSILAGEVFPDAGAYFNYLTRTGLDQVPSWRGVAGNTVEAIDYLQFLNPGDTRVAAAGRGCGTGSCHGDEHEEWLKGSPMATNSGLYSKARFAAGLANANGSAADANTTADYAFRAVTDVDYDAAMGDEPGRVESLRAYPETAAIDPQGGNAYASTFASDLGGQAHTGDVPGFQVNQLILGSDLAALVTQVIGQACGDCHLGTAGANNRYGEFRSSGCTSCHMEYDPSGRYRGNDPTVNRTEPADSDAIAAPERPHVARHVIQSVGRALPGCGVVRGIDDLQCASCHQESNETVLQYWGIRSDRNQDVVNGFQYPANPVSFVTAEFDTRLFDPAVGNQTFLGRVANQLLLEEDYDGDGRDDTPPDVHYEAGMGCIDCHGSNDLHNGFTSEPLRGIVSQQHQSVAVTCESCHGTVDDEPSVLLCVTYEGLAAECAVDRFGGPLRNVTRETVNGEQHFKLRSKVTTATHWVPLTRDLVDALGDRTDPVTGNALFSPKASYAMGRIGDGPDTDGFGPLQANPVFSPIGFSHTEALACDACHTAWVDNCLGCHLKLTYNADPANFFFSNTTGERTVMNYDAVFAYQSPVLRHLTVETTGRIAPGQSGMKTFFAYQDVQGNNSAVFAFTDRRGFGNVPDVGGRNAFPALSHNRIAPHSTRGAPTSTAEGVIGCNVCHLTEDALSGDYNADGVSNAEDYDAYRSLYLSNDFAGMNVENAAGQTLFEVMVDVVGSNFGNQLDHPIYVAVNAGLGTGLFLFDANGCPVNPVDANANRAGCDGNAPADTFDANSVVFDLDRTVELSGVENVSMSKALDQPSSPYRTGALSPVTSGPLGGNLLERLTDPNLGVVLDSWLDADGVGHGLAP